MADLWNRAYTDDRRLAPGVGHSQGSDRRVNGRWCGNVAMKVNRQCHVDRTDKSIRFEDFQAVQDGLGTKTPTVATTTTAEPGTQKPPPFEVKSDRDMVL